MIDGGLKDKFKKGLSKWHWQPIETGTGQGVPDLEFCSDAGVSGWIENKKITSGSNFLDHPISMHQAAWIKRRIRMGGRAFVAVRKHHGGGPRLGDSVDILYLFHGREVDAIISGGIMGARPLGAWGGGARGWNWGQIGEILSK